MPLHHSIINHCVVVLNIYRVSCFVFMPTIFLRFARFRSCWFILAILLTNLAVSLIDLAVHIVIQSLTLSTVLYISCSSRSQSCWFSHCNLVVYHPHYIVCQHSDHSSRHLDISSSGCTGSLSFTSSFILSSPVIGLMLFFSHLCCLGSQ